MSTRGKRLAIVGCGSSGLVTLKMALEMLPDWDVVAFEKSDSIRGCWGDPHGGFVSTSTRYTTQFACFPKWHAHVKNDGGKSREEFFRDGEYGDYLDGFADAFGLRKLIRLGTTVENIQPDREGGWMLQVGGQAQKFEVVVVCMGLAARATPVETSVALLAPDDLTADKITTIENRTIVVVGGGESAVGYADRLARKSLGNRVYLSLRSGIRVSPRYHPVRGVPSDFLRNRMMLSADPAIRNWLGERFVRARMRYQHWFEKVFPSGQQLGADQGDQAVQRIKGEWAERLTLAAKDDLFNMFHNKSDDFLDAVAEGRIVIAGPPTGRDFSELLPFGADQSSEPKIKLNPDFVVPAVGYESTLDEISGGILKLSDFYLGCCHSKLEGIFAVGYARPIIGNIPSISEMQARYVCSLIGGQHPRPRDLQRIHEQDRAALCRRYRNIDVDKVLPVEMFPYCDQLAKEMGLAIGPSVVHSFSGWWKCLVSPATTMHYFWRERATKSFVVKERRYMPWLLVLLILLVKPFDWIFKFCNSLKKTSGK